jgi:hypothetical protein
VTTIAELAEDRTVEGVFAVTKKERRRTRNGAPYLALELADASGRVEARVWNDVDLLDQRFGEGDAVHVLGRVERFGGKLQVQVRAVEPAEETDPSTLTPSLRRDADELDGFFEFLASEITHEGLSDVVDLFVRDKTVRAGLRTLPACGSGRPPRLRRRPARAHGRASRPCAARPRSSIPGFVTTCSSLPPSSTTSVGSASSEAGLRSVRRRRAACSDTSTSGSA